MRAIFDVAVTDVLAVLKFVVAFGLIYAGAATKKPFLLMFGFAMGLVASAYLLDLSSTVGRDSDILLSIIVSLAFGLSVCLVTGFGNPNFNTAIGISLVALVHSTVNGLNGNRDMYMFLDAITSAVAALSLGMVVAIQSMTKRPALSLSLIVVSICFSIGQLLYFDAGNIDHYQEFLASGTVLYGTLIGVLYISSAPKVPPSDFDPRNVFVSVQAALSERLQTAFSGVWPRRLPG